jgi:SAM-dependent methyltransferase
MMPAQRMVSESEEGYQPAPTLSQMNLRLLDGYSNWTSVNACPVCSSPGIQPFAQLRSIQHSRCTACGFIFVNPIPPHGVTDALYNSTFYNNYRYLEEARQQHDRYFSISAYTDQRDLARWLTASKPASVLDFGCGVGNFLALLRDEFGVPHVEGLELNKKSVQVAQRCYGLKLATSADQLEQQHYDAAVLLEVIEHVSDVHGVFGLLADRIRVGGRLLITTPAVDGFVARRLPSQCPHYTAPSHVSLFTEQSLRRLVESHGFKMIEVRVDASPMPFQSALRSLFYNLDFASPSHDDDTDDIWWQPTALGRLFRCPEGRKPRLPFRLGGVIRLSENALSKIRNSARKPDHLYVMAEKVS